VADIFSEVDEEVRREQLKRIWERYGILIIAAAVLVVLGVAGYRGYQYWEAKQAAAASASFEQAMTLSEQDKHAEAQAAFAKVAAEAPAGYRTLARLRAAAELSKTDPKAAVGAFDAIAADGSVGLAFQDAAALRAGMLLVDTAPLDEMRRRLEPLAEPSRPFRHSAREMLTLSAWRNNDFTAAKKYIEQVSNDPETPQGIRSRVDVLSALVAAGGKG
jgi:hypothetical protein